MILPSFEHFISDTQYFFKNCLQIPINCIATCSLFDDTHVVDAIAQIKDFVKIQEISLVGYLDKIKNKHSNPTNWNEWKTALGTSSDQMLFFAISIASPSPKDTWENFDQKTFFSEITRSIQNIASKKCIVILFLYQHDATTKYITITSTSSLKHPDIISQHISVRLLRDIDISNPHRGHKTILQSLIPSKASRRQGFEGIYRHWNHAFDVHVIQKQFYHEIVAWFLCAMKHTHFPNEQQENDELSDIRTNLYKIKTENVIRLLMRVLFCWYLHIKNVIPKIVFDYQEIQKTILHVSSSQKDSVYYKAILQNIFFGALNCPIFETSKTTFLRGFWKAQGIDSPQRSHHLMRFADCFRDTDFFLTWINAKIPYIQSSLFQCLDDEEQGLYVDGFSETMPEGLKCMVPDVLFFPDTNIKNTKQTTQKTQKTQKQNKNDIFEENQNVIPLIPILQSYCFRCTENTPFEKDIALDSEMMGHIFENILAMIPSKNLLSKRKTTGSFYTPTNIVSYMVEESLIAFYKANLSVVSKKSDEFESKIRNLIQYGIADSFTNEERGYIIQGIAQCKILDPSCGAGAFCMDAAQKIIQILQIIDPQNTIWQYAKPDIFNANLKAIWVASNDTYHEHYKRMLYVFLNCIYGIDIQPIAIQIVKMRCCLSLLSKQNFHMSSENLGIHPFPNLDGAFVVANALYDLPYLSTVQKIDHVGHMKEIRASFFHILHSNQVSNIEKQEQKHKMKELLRQKGYAEEVIEQICRWNPKQSNMTASFFDVQLMFGIDTGFDIVIGNPPYIGHKSGNKDLFRELKNSQLGQTYSQERMDMFYYFFHLAIEITNRRGIISFITTNYYPTVDSASKLRHHIMSQTYPFLFVDCNDVVLFDSARGQHNLLTFLSKTKIENQIRIVDVSVLEDIQCANLYELLRYSHLRNSHIQFCEYGDLIDPQTGFFLIKEKVDFIDGMQKNAIVLKELFDVSQGMVTGADKVTQKHLKAHPQLQEQNLLGHGIFVVSSEFFNSLPPKEQNILIPWRKNSDIRRFGLSSIDQLYVIQLTADIKISEYPHIQAHILKFQSIIQGRNFESGELKKALARQTWWALSSARKDFDFSKPKIWVPYRTNKGCFGYSTEKIAASADVFFIVQKEINHLVSLETLLLFVNSKLYFLYLYTKGRRKGTMLELYKTPLEAIPIPKLKAEEYMLCTFLSRCIIYAKQQNISSTTIEYVSEFLVLEHCLHEDFKKMIHAELHTYCTTFQSDIDVPFQNVSDDIKRSWIQQMKTDWENQHSKHSVIQAIERFTKHHSKICETLFDKDISEANEIISNS